MDQIIQRVRRAFIGLMEHSKIHNYHLSIIFLLFLTKTDWFKDDWFWKQPIPTRLLEPPIRATIILTSMLHKFPSFPDDNIKNIIFAIIIQIANGIMCAAHFDVICAYSPEYCYEEYPDISNGENVATEMMFLAFQGIITINMLIAVWYVTSLRKVITAAIFEIVKFVRKDIFTIAAILNFVIVVAKINMQDVVIAGMLIFIICKLIVDAFLVGGIIDFMVFDIAVLLDDYEPDDWEYVMNARRVNNGGVNGFRFLDFIDPDG